MGRARPQGLQPLPTANRPPVSIQRPPEILDVDILWEGRGETQGAGTGLARAETEPGTTEGRRRAAPGESAPHPGRVRLSSSWLPEPLGRGRHKRQAQPNPRFFVVPENWNRTQCRALSI